MGTKPAELNTPGIYDASQFSKLQLTPAVQIVEGLFHEEETVLWAGAFAAGKTMAALQLTICLATGKPYLGRKVARPYRVALLDFENGPRTMLSRYTKQKEGLQLTAAEEELLSENWHYVDGGEETNDLFALKLIAAESWARLAKFLEDNPAEVVIIDNLGLVFPSETTAGPTHLN